VTLTTDDDRPLATQTAAPPIVPPRHPIVAAGLQDDAEWRARFQEQQRQLAALIARADEILARHSGPVGGTVSVDGYP
jgi:hypothetical protein